MSRRMRKRAMYGKVLFAAVFVLALAISSGLFAADVFFVQSVKAKVMSGPSFKSEVLGEVAKGHQFASTGKEGSWTKVRFGDKDGYVSSLLLAPHAPLQKQGLITGEEAEIKEGARRRASTFVSAAAARGLTAEDRKRLSKEEKINYDALEKMESLTVSEEELSKFMEAGI